MRGTIQEIQKETDKAVFATIKLGGGMIGISSPRWIPKSAIENGVIADWWMKQNFG